MYILRTIKEHGAEPCQPSTYQNVGPMQRAAVKRLMQGAHAIEVERVYSNGRTVDTIYSTGKVHTVEYTTTPNINASQILRDYRYEQAREEATKAGKVVQIVESGPGYCGTRHVYPKI